MDDKDEDEGRKTNVFALTPLCSLSLSYFCVPHYVSLPEHPIRFTNCSITTRKEKGGHETYWKAKIRISFNFEQLEEDFQYSIVNATKQWYAAIAVTNGILKSAVSCTTVPSNADTVLT
jgi:hypothetical protein